MLPLPQVIELFALPTEFAELPMGEPVSRPLGQRAPVSIFAALERDLRDPLWALAPAADRFEAIPH